MECKCFFIPPARRGGGWYWRRSPRISAHLVSVSLSAFRFRNRSRKPIGGFLSYCTHTHLLGGVDVSFGVDEL